MKTVFFILACFILNASLLFAQVPSFVKSILPEGTVIHTDISYAADTSSLHKLDIYLPPNPKKSHPLLIWIHGGGWTAGNKYGDMDYMKSLVKTVLDSGYVLASINYRFATEAVFPAQIQDCNQAIDFLYENAANYSINRNRIALIGFSAGGHLASLVGTSNNNEIPEFNPNREKPNFKIRAVVDFYGPSDFIARIGSMKLDEGNQKSTSTNLLGVQPVLRPDLAKFASPTTYIDKDDPPFLIIHGEKDQQVPITLSKLLDSYLKLAGVPSEMIIVPGAPHSGELFGAEAIKNKVMIFLKTHLK